MANLISAVFPLADVTTVNENLETFKTKMPFLKSLSAKEKQSLYKPGENYIPFIERCVNIVEAHPEIMSGTFNVEEFKKDVELFVILKPIYQKLALLYQAMDDTITAAGCDALE